MFAHLHLHIYISAHLHILTSAHLHLSLFFSFSLKAGGGAAGALRNATLCGDRACRGREMQVRARFGDLAPHYCRQSCTKRSFWRLRTSHLEDISYETLVLETWRFTLEDISYETLVLETWRFTFGGRLVRNARFGDLALHFWRTSRTKRSFWRLGASLLEDVSYETLVLETWRFTFGGRLVRNARFGDLALHFWRTSRTKRSFWRLGASLLEEASYETLILETWRFTCGAGLRPSQFVVQM